MNQKIYLSSPHLGQKERKYVKTAFDTNWVAPLGPNVTGFEEDIEHYLGGNVHVAALSSGTAAIHLALILLGVTKGDEVLCQSMTFTASANPILYQDATPVFVDSEPDTFNICPDALEIAIKSRLKLGITPKAIIAVHLYGMPFKVEAIINIAKKYNIPLVEDSAEALGSHYKEKKCGTFGDIAILSFNGNKIITTSGGGALVSKTKQIKEKAIFFATQARDNAPHYQHSQLGFNYRLSNICAGIGRGQMEVLPDRILQRRAMHQFYDDLFKDRPEITIFKEPSSHYYSNHWLTCILINTQEAKYTPEQLRNHLENHNIESRPLWKPMHLQPLYKTYPFYSINNISEKLFNTGLCLPSGSNLSTLDKQKISSVISSFFKKY